MHAIRVHLSAQAAEATDAGRAELDAVAALIEDQ